MGAVTIVGTLVEVLADGTKTVGVLVMMNVGRRVLVLLGWTVSVASVGVFIGVVGVGVWVMLDGATVAEKLIGTEKGGTNVSKGSTV